MRNFTRRIITVRLMSIFLFAPLSFPPPLEAQSPGQNINMVSGTKWPDGDPFLQRQNEPSIAVSTRNPRHLLAGANDYRTVDLNFFATGETGDAWLGIFKSFDAGATWQSTLLPGYPLDQTPEGKSSPLKAFNAASDPVVRPGTNGLFFYSGTAFNRGSNTGAVFVSRFIDLNNKENGNAGTGATASNTDPIRYISTAVIDTGNAGQFLDKPWVIADIPRGLGSCTVTVAEPGAASGTVTQSFPTGNVYVAWTRFVGGDNLIRTQIYVSRSLDCGATWSTPDKVSEGFPINQGTALAVDPTNGNLYVAWRTFAAASTPDGINVAVSTDGGQTFSKGIQVISLPPFDPTNPTAPSFFDLQSSGTQMRALAFPTIAVDNASRVYIAWSQRGVGPNGDARIMITTSTTNGLSWSAPMPVDNNAVTDDFNVSFSRGHQLLPQLTFSGGKLMALYYDLRLDHTVGFFTPNFPFAPDPIGRFYLEARTPKGELPGNPAAVFTPFLDDAGLTQRRHTIEVFVAQASPGSPPSFSSPGTRVTNYRFGLRNDFNDPAGEAQQLQVDPPNFPLFKGGTTPFFGDYVDIAGLAMLPQANSWVFNTGSSSVNTGSPIAPVFHATWTDNRDVRPPKDGNWQNYTPVGGGGSSIFSPGTISPSCLSGNEGMRNQNIYTSRITQGLVVSSPQNTKPLSASLQRAFVVLVQNQTNFDKSFRLSIASQPPGGFASFKAGTNNPGPTPPAGPPTPPFPVVTTLDVKAPAHSGAAGSVFAVSTSPTASITVNVDEITAPMGSLVPGGLSSFVVLNPDASNPSLINPDGAPAGTDIASLEIYNPNFSNPNFSNPNFSNPNYSNPNFSNPNYSNPNFSNPNFSNPDIAGSTVPNPNYSNGDLTNPNYSNPNYSNPNFSNTNLTSTLVADASYTLTNKGNTSAGYDVNLVLAGKLPSNAKFQLLINKTYLTPVAQNCTLQQEQTTAVASVINNPNFSNPNFSNPNFSNPNFSNGSLSLAPGDSATITVRGFNVTCSTGTRCRGPLVGVPNIEDIVTQVAPVVTAQAANTNDPTNTPQTAAPLFITTFTLPDAVTGTVYSQNLQAVGGTPPYTWAISSGVLPGGLTLGPATGVISGTPNTAGTSSFTVQVTDSSSPTALTSSKPLSIRVANPLTVTTASPLPTATQGVAISTLNFTATGGIAPYSWTPVTVDGMTLNSSGVFSGTPSLTGTFNFTAQVTDSTSPSQTATKSMTLNVVPATPPPPPSSTLLCDNFNGAGVTQSPTGPPTPTTCTLSTSTEITQVATYHYNGGAGATPGTISLQGPQSFGPFTAVGVTGQNNVANAAWLATPNVIVPAGTYTLIDSGPATWSFNTTSSNAGFVRVWGFAVPTLAFVTQPSNTVAGLVISPAVQVKATDSTGAALSGISISLSIGSNPGGGTFTLIASAPGVASVTSNTFSNIAPATFTPGTLLVAHSLTDGSCAISQLDTTNGSLLQRFGTLPGTLASPCQEFRAHLALSGGFLFRSNGVNLNTISQFSSNGTLVRTITPNTSTTPSIVPIARDFATLSGTTTVSTDSTGIATFSDLRISNNVSIYMVDTFGGTTNIRHLDNPSTGASSPFATMSYTGIAGTSDLYFGGPAGSQALFALTQTNPSITPCLLPGCPYRVAKINSTGSVQFFDNPNLIVRFIFDVGSLAVDPTSGNIYVATGTISTTQLGKIVELSTTGAALGSFTLDDGKPSLDVDVSGNIFVGRSNSSTGEISVFSPSGGLVKTILVPNATSIFDILIVPNQ